VTTNHQPDPALAARPFVLPAVVLGVGLGGLLDGLLLHQVLQWHHMTSAVDPPVTVAALDRNTLADGTFHAAAWLATLAGVLLLWRAMGIARGRPSTGVLVGGMLIGLAAFNLVEGIVDHLVLRLHHVRDGPDAFAYDLAFLLLSAIVFVAGSGILRRALTASRPMAGGPAAEKPPVGDDQRQARTERGRG